MELKDALRERDSMEEQREQLLSELRTSLEKVNRLSGLIPVCSACKLNMAFASASRTAVSISNSLPGTHFIARAISRTPSTTGLIAPGSAGIVYVDSGGLGILVGLAVSARNRGGELKLVSPTQRVSDLLRRTRLDAIISVYRSEKDAVAAFRKQAA